MKQDMILIAGAGGFIGGHLVAELLRRGARVRGVDIKPRDEWFQLSGDAENLVLDLRELEACRRACRGARAVYNFACDMGGMGFIENHKAACMVSVLINTNLLRAGHEAGVERHFFASSVCIYNTEYQKDLERPPLQEHEAYPALPDDGYGWEKLFSERMCQHFQHDYGIQTRVARYQPVYGPFGAWEGGRERAPAAICRKVIQAKVSGEHEIEIWGDGSQTRSFMYIDDCIQGTQMLLESEHGEPINMGPADLVSINQLVDAAERIAGIKLKRHYKLDAPIGVGGRRIDNRKLREVFDWEPATPFDEGLEQTYAWIYDQYASKYGAPTPRRAIGVPGRAVEERRAERREVGVKARAGKPA
jgi:GDP-D-mannose 3', 5'-epimerase